MGKKKETVWPNNQFEQSLMGLHLKPKTRRTGVLFVDTNQLAADSADFWKQAQDLMIFDDCSFLDNFPHKKAVWQQDPFIFQIQEFVRANRPPRSHKGSEGFHLHGGPLTELRKFEWESLGHDE